MYKVAYLAILLLLEGNGMAYAGDLEEQKAALDIIANFADRLCKTIPLEKGQADSLELSGSAKVELNKLIKSIVDLGVEGAAKYKTEEWQGVLQKDLPNLLKDNIHCKIEVWKDLRDKLLRTKMKSDAKAKKKEVLVISDDFETNRYWPEYPNGHDVVNYYGQGGFVVENVTKDRAATWGFWKLGVVQASAKIEITTKQLAGAMNQPVGMLFGGSDTDYKSAYFFGITADGYYILVKQALGKQEKLIQRRQSSVVKKGLGATNRLRVQIDGPAISYFINDLQLGRYTADKEVEGFIGIFLNWPGMKAVFDDLIVTEYIGAAH